MTELLEAQNRAMPGLIAGFRNSVERFPARPALFVDGGYFTYDSLGKIVRRLAATVLELDHNQHPLVAVLAHRSLTAYASVLAIHSTGKGYVPLNPKMPVERLVKMLRQSECELLTAGREALQILEVLLHRVERRLTILLPDLADETNLSCAFPHHRFITADRMSHGSHDLAIPCVNPDAVAYLLFTSGSTGEPKGVPVSQSNVKSYVQYVCDKYQVNEHDRFSQMFDMTFDLSVHDMFVCWERGACLYSVPEKSVMAPAKFIKDHQLTMWFSVPSVAGVMSKMGMLKPGAFSSLRFSLFCGEPLPATYASLWQEAAPQSVIENLYGPTETTIAITGFRWNSRNSPSVCVNGIVPIGWVFEGHTACVVDQERNPVSTGTRGELSLAGPQVTRGYLNNPGQTAEQFVRLRSLGDRVWYRTGDLVTQDQSGCFYYLGRIDHQVKIRGYRVELQEIDFVLREASGSQQVASVAWPVREGIADGIVGFICGGTNRDANAILGHCREALPEYMVPRQIYYLDDIPLNVNGKTDRLKLIKILENQEA